MGKKTPALQPLPAPGAAFAFPIGDGRWSVCRVLACGRPEHAGREDLLLVALSAWIGSEVPGADDPALRPILVLDHHAWKSVPELNWVSGAPPPEFVSIGDIPPTEAEAASECNAFGAWKGLARQPLIQWRWHHDQAAVLAEDALKRERDVSKRATQERERKEYLKRITLDELSRREFFPSWKEYPSENVRTASRRIMVETVERLRDLPRDASRKEHRRLLRECIEAFNELDTQFHFIETVEREDICEEFEAMCHASGFGSEPDMADRWRDW